MWREDFENVDLRLSPTEGCRRETDSERGSVIVCEKGGQGRASLPVRPRTGYRIHLQGRRYRPLSYVITVTEFSHDAPLRIFQFPDLHGRWQSYEIWLFSAPQSRRLEIAIESRHMQGRLWLDDIVVERLDLTPDQELSLLKGQRNRPAPEPYLGLVKRGRLLPLDDPETPHSPLAGNYVIRDAIFAPAPTDMHFRVQIPRDGRLSLAY
ncbi:MAG: hypothetical protein GY856_42630, partial [bacterium]|nr:hypothetical protein [bacterium]